MRAAAGPETVPRPCPEVLDPHAAAAHLTRLNRLAYSLCGSAQLADDLTQETYLRVLSRPRRLQGNEFPYLARTLRNVLNDHRRAERRRPALVSDEQLADDAADAPTATPRPPPGPARCTRRSPRSRAMREVVAAVDLAGLSYAEAAEALRIPLGTVMSRLHRARARLAGALAANTERTLPDDPSLARGARRARGRRARCRRPRATTRRSSPPTTRR